LVLKKEMGIANPDDRKGERRAMVASASMASSILSENLMYASLIEKYGKINVHRWEPYADGIQKRSDFGIYTADGKHYFIDIFWASNYKNAMNCINIKLNKIPEGVMDQIFLVCTNREINKKEMYLRIKNKTNKIPGNITVLEISDFESKITAGDF
jgi:hypothetical protein